MSRKYLGQLADQPFKSVQLPVGMLEMLGERGANSLSSRKLALFCTVANLAELLRTEPEKIRQAQHSRVLAEYQGSKREVLDLKDMTKLAFRWAIRGDINAHRLLDGLIVNSKQFKYHTYFLKCSHPTEEHGRLYQAVKDWCKANKGNIKTEYFVGVVYSGGALGFHLAPSYKAWLQETGNSSLLAEFQYAETIVTKLVNKGTSFMWAVDYYKREYKGIYPKVRDL